MITGGRGVPGDTPERILRTAPTGTVARPVLDAYRVRRERGVWFVMEHLAGSVRIYARLTGLRAEERANAIANELNEEAAA